MFRYFQVFTLSTLVTLSVQVVGAATIDTNPDFEYHTFTSCEEFEGTLKKILPTTYNDGRMYKGGGIMFDSVSVGTVAPTASRAAEGTVPKSETNVQVKGIDEADTVKTDGKYLYSYQEGEHSIVILDAKTLARVKSIRVPTNYSGVNFYVTNNKLILTATRSIQTQKYWTFWFNATQKSIIALYDIRDIAHTSLVREIEVDGYLSDTRLGDTGIMTAVVATSYWMPPVYRYYFDSAKNINQPKYDYSSKNLVPRITDQQFASGKRTTTNRNMGDCTGMSSILPHASSLSQYNFNPTLTSILRFDTSIPVGPITSQIVLSDAGQIHVTRDSVYLTANMWLPKTDSACPPGAQCMTPMIWNPGISSTLVHRFAVTNRDITYSYSRLIPGYPLNQYSMDEDTGDNFRIITSVTSWSGGVNNSSTELSVLNPSGMIIGTLSGIAPGENFQSSRFIGSRLYLVTFQQIDPLFVIDLSDAKNPKSLGELKIPGYSTYLHPYDADRLIGIGYDTFTNSHGGTQNGGLKVDLYNVSDIKNPRREASLTLGDAGSTSDALWNPKAFVWYKEEGLLLLPATLMTSAKDPDNSYLSAKAFQGLIGVSITPNSIIEKFRITHIVPSPMLDTSWKKDCEQYAKNNAGYEQYIPIYCKAGGTLDMYLANTIWNYSSDFISRVLYVGENFYTIGANRIQSQTFTTPTIPTAVQSFKIRNQYNFPIAVDVLPMLVR